MLRGCKPTYHAPRTTHGLLEDFAAAHPEVHNLLCPTPERVLLRHSDTRHFVAVPASHHLFVLRPDLHAVARYELLPVLRHRGLSVKQPDRDVPRQVFDRAYVDLGVELRGRHASGAGEIGHTVGEHHDVER